MQGKVPPEETKSSRDYVHVDVREGWLDVQVSPAGARHRFANNSRGIGQLINLCRQLGVSKINMKSTDECGARARHALTVAGLSVTGSNSLRARMFADARGVGKAWPAPAPMMAIALSLAGLAAWQWDRVGRTLASATETTKELSFDTKQKFESAPGALASFLKDVFGRLEASNRSDKGEERDLSVARGKIGEVQLSQGDRAAALQSSRESLDIFKALSAAVPGDKSRRGDLLVGEDGRGDIQLAPAGRAAAPQTNRDSLALAKASSAAAPGDDGRRRDLAIAYEKLGDVRLAQGELATALQFYRDSFAVVQALSVAAPGDNGRRRDLAIAYEKLGDVRLAQGELATALQFYRDSFAVVQALSVAAPGDNGRRRDLAIAYEKLGDVRLAQGELATASQFYRDSFAVVQALSVAAPGDDGPRRDMIVICMKLSVAEPPNARDYLSKAQAIAKKLADKDRLTSSDRAWAAEIDKRLMTFGDAANVASPGKPNR